MKKWMYYVIQWTWGLPMTLLGAIVFCIYKACRCNTYWWRNAVCIVVPWNFGGLELGMFFVRGKWNESVCAHEYGHGIQNMWWGWLFPFVIAIPSAARYWWRIIYKKWIYPKKRVSLPPYDAIWFEGQATKLGEKAEENAWSWL